LAEYKIKEKPTDDMELAGCCEDESQQLEQLRAVAYNLRFATGQKIERKSTLSSVSLAGLGLEPILQD
jgi:hypothetical protein